MQWKSGYGGKLQKFKNSKIVEFKAGFWRILNNKKRIIEIFGKRKLQPMKVDVPGDPSSAAFFTALTLLNDKSSIKIKNVGLNPTRIGFYKLLKNNGAKIKFKNVSIQSILFNLSTYLSHKRFIHVYFINYEYFDQFFFFLGGLLFISKYSTITPQ